MRYNIFDHVHQPLRYSLLNTCVYLSSKDFTHEEAINRVNEVLAVFKAQLKYETSYILPLIFEYEPSIWQLYTTEHSKATNKLRDIEALVQSIGKVKDGRDGLPVLKSITKAFNDFVLFNYRHMDEEEEVLNEILWRYYKDDVILQMHEESEILPSLVKQHQHKNVYTTAKAA